MVMYQFLFYVWFQGQCVFFEEVRIFIVIYVLYYGIGVFGGMCVIFDFQNSNIMLLFCVDWYVWCFSQSVWLLFMDLSEEMIFLVFIVMLQVNKFDQLIYLWFFVYISDLGIVLCLYNIEIDFLIYGFFFGDYFFLEGVSCRISSWICQEDCFLLLCGKIFGVYIISFLVKMEVVQSGFDEVLLLNSCGKISEVSGMNLFLVCDGQLIMFGVDQDIFEGIICVSVIELVKVMDIFVIECFVDKIELFIVDEVFFFGMVVKVMLICQIELMVLNFKCFVMDVLKVKLVVIIEGWDFVYEYWVICILIF